MKDFMIMLITHSAALSVVIILLMAITPLLSKHCSARGLYYSWLVIVIGLLIPFRLQLKATTINLKVPTEEILTNAIPVAPTLPAKAAAHIVDNVPYPALTNIRWWQPIAAIWLIGVIFFLFYNGIKHYQFIKMIFRWRETITDEQILLLMRNIRESLVISRHIDLYICPYISSPMLIGLFHPQILLPTADFSQEELHFILKHELVHYKRKDLWYKCLLLAATAMHWFNPAVYLMAKAINIQCELSCDTEVIQSSNINTRYRYCETIIGLLKTQSKLKTALSTNFYGGKNYMKSRISSIMDTRRKKVGLTVICAVLIMTLGIGITNVAANSANTSNSPANNADFDVDIRLRDYINSPENYGTSVSNVDSRPGLEFYIGGEDIAQIEVTCNNEYLYAVDWTKTQHEKYWNTDYYQTYDEKTRTSAFHPERLYDKSIKFRFDEGFSEYNDIWYRWTAWDLYKWASEDNFSHFSGYDASPETELPDDMTEEQKLQLASGYNGSGALGSGHIQLDGYPEELTKDRITVKITDRKGNSVTKYINIEISNDELNQTVVTASLVN